MGIRILSKTWRSPLQLIDSWLPAPAPQRTAQRPLGPLLRSFTRAGWLGRGADTLTCGKATAPSGPISCPASTRPTPNRTPRTTKVVRGPARMVISGRMVDVCAELDRLAALEQRCGTA
ncbi:MAG: hypothetical protein JNK17_17710 [Hydrogenophaga sp.]|nr:hypothetical protein [Hydrogenophaga sp.]